MRHKACFSISLALAFAFGWTAGVCRHPDSTTSAVAPAAYFSPGGGAREAILEQVRAAKKEIIVALYYFTDQGLADALAEAKGRGVAVMVLLDRSQKKGRHSQAQRLMNAGIIVLFDSRHRILHHKFVVVDGRTLITGSQNWTRSAETVNAENTLIIVSEPVLTGKYRSEFYRLWEMASPEDIQP